MRFQTSCSPSFNKLTHYWRSEFWWWGSSYCCEDMAMEFMMVLLHPRSVSILLRKHCSEPGRHLLKLFMIGLMLKEKLKDGKSLGNSYFRILLKLQWTFSLITNLEMISFSYLKRKKQLPNKRGRRSKRNKRGRRNTLVES